jgi:hypothetical protein
VLPKPWTWLDVDEFMKIINRNARSLQTTGDPRRANGSAGGALVNVDKSVRLREHPNSPGSKDRV